MFILNATRFTLAASLGLSASSALAQVVHPGGSAAPHVLTSPRVSTPPLPLTPLYAFSGAGDGGGKSLNVTVDSDGALYGTTLTGGSANNGVVFKLTPPAPGNAIWSETVLYSFSGPDGASPWFTPSFDSWGALYGATSGGGANNIGVAFKLTPPAPPATQWTAAALYNFAGGADGGTPGITLAMDSRGALYGGTASGGASGNGAVFMLTPPGANCTPAAPNLWCETVLYSFAGDADGAGIVGGVTLDSHGALYGVTQAGGAYGYGQLFKLTPPTPASTPWIKTTLYSFTGGADGANPFSAPVLIDGALYGATTNKGNCSSCGAIYRLRPPVPPAVQWIEDTLWSFTGGADGGAPVAGLTFAPSNLGRSVSIFGSTPGQIFALQCAPRAREVFGGAPRAACIQ
ncbi:choice-of-anchor tandem repeat GloVer-containing protein [Methylocystis heyeri]|uniref:Uncharacterized protein n=1 Tax=Methylocystis heyeri TaxID=391905 RepID=A0A6B8KAZ5_9HYPH|nr:choice-of-anchor tandem repeat GloVer-containing protein [Methylocystis heyeri]QGM44682.1 hypothetical protein H2LOC_002695 [Methylocystis heyeri]